MKNLDHIKMQIDEAATIKDCLTVEKDSMPKEINLYRIDFPPMGKMMSFAPPLEGEFEHAKYIQLSPGDIVISRKELEGMKQPNDYIPTSAREKDLARYGFNKAIDKILKMNMEITK